MKSIKVIFSGINTKALYRQLIVKNNNRLIVKNVQYIVMSYLIFCKWAL